MNTVHHFIVIAVAPDTYFQNLVHAMKFLTCLLTFLTVCFHCYAQQVLKGVVVDEKNQPVVNASIFLNNTSVGTKADSEGKFQLTIPNGRYELIISAVGHQTKNIPVVSTHNSFDFLTIRLDLKTDELETVVIEPYEKDGWKKWGQWFIENFIGTSEYAGNCRIKNPEVLRFRHNKKTNQLKIIAKEPLVIENKSLGYLLTYQLEQFSYDFRTRYLLYTGYPYFQPLEGSDRKQRQWELRRNEVFEGSMLHFMRSLFRNRILEAGFEVRSLKKIPNEEKRRAKQAYRNNINVVANGALISGINSDSIAYYQSVLQQDDFRNVYSKDLLTGDSIAYALDSTTAGLGFEDYLLITYKNKTTPKEYRQMFPKSSTEPMSEITLINGKHVAVLSNGSFFEPTELLTTGYWAWSEKMATMLPFDFKPTSKSASR